MSRKNRRRESSRGGMIFFVLLMIIAIVGLVIYITTVNNSDKKVSDNKEEKTNTVADYDNNEVNPNESKTEESLATATPDENKDNEKTAGYKLNHLAEDEASFGKLDVPVYKKSEKNIKIPILIYHGFFTPMLSSEDDPYRLMCSEELFEEQITTLLDAGYTFVTLEDIYKYDKGTIGLPEKNICITMDDGWEGNYTDAFWLLKKYNIPATIFIVDELVGTTGYFDWNDAKEMYDSGLVKIHVHGKRHISATGYSKEGLQDAYTETHSKIEEVMGEKLPKIMAYPAGDSSASTIEWLKEVGFEIQVQTNYGTVNKSKTLDLTDLGRIRAEKASGSSILNTIEKASAE